MDFFNFFLDDRFRFEFNTGGMCSMSCDARQKASPERFSRFLVIINHSKNCFTVKIAVQSD